MCVFPGRGVRIKCISLAQISEHHLFLSSPKQADSMYTSGRLVICQHVLESVLT